MPPARPTPDVRAARGRPDPRPLRLLLGLAGIASASAVLTALLPSVAPPATPATLLADVQSQGPLPSPSVVHVTKYVTLKPGETAPPKASVIIPPSPSPQVRIVTVTRQSGKP